MLPTPANNDETLRALAAQYVPFLRHSQSDLADICYSAAVKRTHHPHRLAVCGRDAEELAARLDAFLGGENPSGVSHGKVNPNAVPPIVSAADASAAERNPLALA